jgi:Flp pilus assembly protein TadG
MKRYFWTLNKLRDPDGVTAIVVGIMLTILLGFAALAIDIGYSRVTKNELQNIADGAALASARQLGVIYETMSPSEIRSYDASAD